jgi:hypothetical protein
MSDGWRIVTRFSGSSPCAHARARRAYNSKNLSLPVTCHSAPFALHGVFQGFSRLKTSGLEQAVMIRRNLADWERRQERLSAGRGLAINLGGPQA